MNKICFAISSMLFVFAILISLPIKAATADQNIQAATEAYKRGSYTDAARLFAAAAEDLAKAKNPQAALLWGNAALAMLKGENYQAAADIYEKLLTGKQNVPQDKLLQFYINSIVCYTKLKQPAMRIATIDALLKKFPKLKPADLAELYASQGDAYFDMELYAPALASYDKAMAKLPSSENPELRMRILGALGECQRTLGYYSEAKKTLSEAEKAAEKLKDPKILAEAKSKLGVLHTEMGDYPEALKRLNDALATEQKSGLRLHEGSEKNNIGQVYLYTGNHEKAMNHFEEGIAIAREVGNKKGQAVATINRALLNRITGNHAKARADYKEGAKLFEECGLKEGQAVTMLGIGKMAELADKNNVEALENYEQALDIFKQLEQPRWQAVSLLLLGDLHKKMKTPGRTTRDMVFDEEPTNPSISEEEALKKSHAYYEQALKIGEDLAADEIIWAAHQGLGFSDYTAGNLESALEHYHKAINIVSNMFLSLQDVQKLGEYMADKEELYNEAMELCAALYQKTKDKKYLDLQLKYADTLKNEIMKASSTLANLTFKDKAKQKLFDELQQLGRSQAQARQSLPEIKALPANPTSEQKAAYAARKKARDQQILQLKKQDADYQKRLAQWKKQYPGDESLFDSFARVDIGAIQKNIKDDQAVLVYNMLPEKLMITTITRDKVTSVPVGIGKEKLENIIKNDFLLGYIQNGYGNSNGGDEKKELLKISNILNTLYKFLIEHVENEIKGKKQLYIVNDGFLAQLPYSALVKTINDGNPEYLVEKYDISYVRPSFIQQAMAAPQSKADLKKLLAIGNPQNKNFWMENLDSAVEEVGYVDKATHIEKAFKKLGTGFKSTQDKDKLKAEYPDLVAIAEEPTEQWFYDQLKNPYEILYFATHGMPYSDTLTSIPHAKKALDKGKKIKSKKKVDITEDMKKSVKMVESNLPGHSILNGFLYLASEKEDDINKKPIGTEKDGLLTMKEIIELPDSSFTGTKYVILSACNTGVSFAPKILNQADLQEILTSQDVEEELVRQGWIPGSDQVGFVDVFMKRGVPNVYGTLWFADDAMSGELMKRFVDELGSDNENKDPAHVFSQAQRNFIKDSRAGKIVHPEIPETITEHPFYWAVGAMFGK